MMITIRLFMNGESPMIFPVSGCGAARRDRGQQRDRGEHGERSPRARSAGPRLGLGEISGPRPRLRPLAGSAGSHSPSRLSTSLA
jgi:hypothetical protein